jgi:hypothetical protein
MQNKQKSSKMIFVQPTVSAIMVDMKSLIWNPLDIAGLVQATFS